MLVIRSSLAIARRIVLSILMYYIMAYCGGGRGRARALATAVKQLGADYKFSITCTAYLRK